MNHILTRKEKKTHTKYLQLLQLRQPLENVPLQMGDVVLVYVEVSQIRKSGEGSILQARQLVIVQQQRV